MAKHRRVTPEQEKEVERLVKEGHTVSFAARELKVPYKTLLATVQRMGLEITRHGRRSDISAEQIQQMVSEYSSGSSTKSLAAKYDVDAGSVTRYLRASGVELRPAGFQRGEAHHAWAGGRIISDEGYVLVLIYPDDPYYPMAQIKSSSGGRYVLEHRLVMAKKLGRLLTEDETVHHKNNNEKQNNSESNLELRQGNHGKGSVFICLDCGSHNISADVN